MNKLISPLSERGWYPHDTRELHEQIDNSIKKSEPQHVSALIAPHAGYRWCSEAIGHAMRHVSDRYTNIILLGPSHKKRFRDFVVTCDYDCISTPLGDCRLSEPPQGRIFLNSNDLHLAEHSMLQHVPYVQKCCPSASVLPVMVSEMSDALELQFIDWLLSFFNEETLLVVSSDFTHYGDKFNYTPYDKNIRDNIFKFDHIVIDYIVNGDYNKYKTFINNNRNTICGRYTILILMNLLQHIKTKPTSHKYLMSGDLVDDYSNTVSYAGIDFIS